MIRRICFVCLGNICRSPMAEGLAREEVRRRGLAIEVASAGTGGWHTGAAPDRRMRETAHRHGVDIDRLRAAAVATDDAAHFDLFVAMDRSNEADLHDIFYGRDDVQIVRLLEFHPGPEEEVPDPYYGAGDGFERVYQLIRAGISGLFDAIEEGRFG